jgi:hypothetical protein
MYQGRRNYVAKNKKFPRFQDSQDVTDDPGRKRGRGIEALNVFDYLTISNLTMRSHRFSQQTVLQILN